ncbi:hypothetical protein AB4Y88_19685, partial [Paenarthrobacter sp. RAF9]
MPKNAVSAAQPGLALTSVRQPGEMTLCDIFITDGIVARIVPAGSRGPSAEASAGGLDVVDLDGRFVIPGLWDEHVHMTQWALAAGRIDLSGAGSAREAAAVVQSQLNEKGSGAAEGRGYG